ncbi:MAG: cell division protein SepF [Candidatus Bathyarchaeia archaeon]
MVRYLGMKGRLVCLRLVKNLWEFIKTGVRRKVKEEVKAEKVTIHPPSTNKIYLKALILHAPEEVERIKDEVRSGNIVIVRISPIVEKSVEDAKRVINELSEFISSVGGDIARLGDERIILTPLSVQIWREKTS